MFCKRPTNSLFINSNGGLRPDPRYGSDIDYIDNYNSLAEYFNSDLLNKIQKNVQAKLDSNCADCMQIANSSSFKPMDIKNDELTTLFLGVSNLCNLECRMCGSYASNKLISRDIMLESLNFKTQYPIEYTNTSLNKEQLTKLFNQIEVFSSLKFIKISGGEPFLEKINFDILDKLSIFSKNISVSIITNGSIFPSKEQLKILDRYKSVTITIGLESIGKCYEYIRKNSNWHITESNIHNFSNLFDIRFFVSLSAYSIYNMHELLDFINTKPTNFQTTIKPEYLNHQIFGNLLYDIYPETLHSFIVNKTPDYFNIFKFFKYSQTLDNFYNTSLFDMQPKFKNLL